MANGSWRNRHIENNGFRQFYRDWLPRQESALPVLALHGSLTQSGMWAGIAETGSVRVVCPDQRGFGLSEDPGSDSCAEFAADALMLAEKLSLGRYVVMGHSFACSIALEVAARNVERAAAIVLVDPVVRIGPAPQAASQPVSPRDSFATSEEAARHFLDTEEGRWTESALQRFIQEIMMRDAQTGCWRFPYSPTRLQRLRSFVASPASDYDLLAKARAARHPVLIFRGGMSKRFPPDAEKPFLEAFGAEPQLVVCPQSGHFPTATEPDIVADQLNHFIAKISAQ